MPPRLHLDLPVDAFKAHLALAGSRFRMPLLAVVIFAGLIEIIEELHDAKVFTDNVFYLFFLASLASTGLFGWFLAMIFRSDVVSRFADSVYTTDFASLDDQVLVSQHSFHVGVKELKGVPARGDGRVPRPNCTVYYPTEVEPTKSSWPCYLPFGDSRYVEGLAKHAGFLPIFTFNYLDGKIKATADPPLASAVTSDLLGSTEHPIVIFSHDVGLHRHSYSAFAMNLVAVGATVICIEHGDGSAAFASPVQHENPTLLAHYDTVEYQPAPKKKNDHQTLRTRQLIRRRIPEVQSVIDFVAQGKLHEAFGFLNRPAHTLVSLAGHGLGAATVTGTALKDPSRRIASVIAFDLWHLASAWIPLELHFNRMLRNSLPPLLLMDSHEWNNRFDDYAVELVLVKAWPNCTRRWTQGTYHSSVTDLTFFGFPGLQNKKLAFNQRRQIALWSSAAYDWTVQWLRTAPSVTPSSPPDSMSD